LPFLRWAGGKRWLVDYIQKIIPENYNNFYEPFLGSAAVYFSTKIPNTAFLSDLNSDLIRTYEVIKDDVLSVIEKLKEFENTKECYYKIRGTTFKKDIAKAAQFIYLNKTSFNGIYRVNTLGKYNVPFGFRKSIDFVAEENLILASKHLQNAKLTCMDFGKTLRNVSKGDFVYLDPPYTVAHENNGFIQYNQKLFSLRDQIRLAKWLKKIDEVGAYYVLSNAKHTAIKEIYKDTGEIKIIKRNSLVGGVGAKRELISEYIITNIK
jgi:DNA adenine methylase